MASSATALPVEALYTRCDPDRFGFETTAELEDIDPVSGQTRAQDAMQFGIGIRHAGALPVAFESEDYRARMEELAQELKERQHEAMSELGKRARAQHIALLRTPGGFAFAPMNDENEVMPPEQFAQLPEAERQRIETRVGELQQALQKIVRQFPLWAKETREKSRAINREIAELAVNNLINGVSDAFDDLPAVRTYLETVGQDVIENVDDFLPQAWRLQRSVNRLLDEPVEGVHYLPVAESELPGRIDAIRRQGGSLLVLPRSSPLLQEPGTAGLLDSAGCPVVLVN